MHDSQIYSPLVQEFDFAGKIITLKCIPVLRMSFFRNFKLPRFLKIQQSSAESIANIKVFDCNALQLKKRLSQGAFGDMYTAEYGTEGNV